jgi:hypothetical protein
MMSNAANEWDWQAESDAMTAATEYLVEASSGETSWIWDVYVQQMKVPHEHISLGIGEEIGRVAGRPIRIHLGWSRFAGHLVCFWELTSMLADYGMAEKWLDKKYPHVKQTANAENFHNIMDAIERADGIRYRQPKPRF